MTRLVTEAEADAERALAGVACGWPEQAATLELEGRHFADPRWRAVWTAGRAMAGEGLAVDPVTLADRLEGDGVKALTLADLMAAFAAVPTASNADHYAAIVRDGWVRRSIAAAASAALDGAAKGEEGAELLSEILRRLAEISLEGPTETRPIREMLKERFFELGQIAEAKAKGDAAATGIPTGLEQLDGLLGGLQRGVATVAAGRPGMGKSAFALACVRSASSRGIGCHVFSLEDTREAYCDRVLSGESRVPAERIRQVALSLADMGQMQWALEGFPKARPWIVDDRAGVSAEEVVRSVRRSISTNRTQLVVVDYVQLLKGPPRSSPADAMTHAMGVLADAAKQDRIAYLVMAQLNRECEKRDDKRPLLSDLKASGAIEERAKCVVMLYRPAVYDEAAPRDVVELLIRKNNQGQTGIAFARWAGETIRMH